jgi:hypothetical protein
MRTGEKKTVTTGIKIRKDKMTIIFKIKPEENYRIAIKNLKLLLP